MAQPAPKHLTVVSAVPRDSSQALIKGELSPEIVFGVVGHIGSGTSLVAHQLESKLKADGYSTHLLKARLAISEWAEGNSIDAPKIKAGERPSLDDVTRMQDLGDQMRRTSNDYAAIAKSLVGKIRERRAQDTQVTIEKGKTVVPDDKKRAFILDSIRHPAEVELLRQVYKHSFVLVGVVCEENARMRRISKKFDNAGDNAALKLMDRDAKAVEAWGQRVSDSFYRSDVFLNQRPRSSITA